ncbi:DAK2 domain-containing protein [Crassaminicella thermophila]|nr:DAK2 domain-containing protein [Crassaminicella thermophila]
MFINGAYFLEENKRVVDELNVFPVPDGDTGTNMSLTMNAAVKEVEAVSNTIDDVVEAVANGSLMGARGNSGVILSQLFRGFAKSCKGKNKLTTVDLAHAFISASDTAYKAVMKPIEGTILTIAREIGEKAVEIAREQQYVDTFLQTLIIHAEKALNKTPSILKVLKEAGVVDAGGKGLIFILKGFYKAITGIDKSIQLSENINIEDKNLEDFTDITFGYCTEFIIKGSNIDLEEIKEKIKDFGDCMLVVGDERLAKVHIHTNNPGIIIESGLKFGELTNIKIDNMRQQHQNKVFEVIDEKIKTEMKEYGMIAVAKGEGLIDIFKDLNVDEIISGGQTMNPSTQDIKKAIDLVQAKNIFIFPNNSNIILAANQAKELSDKNIIVIPSKTIPQGISSILAYNEDLSIDENIEFMMEALKNVKTGQITYSVRDTKMNDMDIKEGDILGIIDGDIEVVCNDVEDAAYKLLESMIDEGDEILTIFYGKESDKQKASNLAKRIEVLYTDIDVEVYYGGQPLYYYIFSVE